MAGDLKQNPSERKLRLPGPTSLINICDIGPGLCPSPVQPRTEHILTEPWECQISTAVLDSLKCLQLSAQAATAAQEVVEPGKCACEEREANFAELCASRLKPAFSGEYALA